MAKGSLIFNASVIDLIFLHPICYLPRLADLKAILLLYYLLKLNNNKYTEIITMKNMGSGMKNAKASSLTFGKALLALSVMMALTACNGDDGNTGPVGPVGMDGQDGTNGQDGSDGANGSPGFSAGLFLLSNNGPTNAGTVDLIDQNAAALKSFTSGNNEGVAIDTLGNLLHAGDSVNGSLRSVCQLVNRSSDDSYDMNIDREITGANTGLINPKGIHLAQQRGLVLVADFNGMRVSAFGSAAAGDVAPIAETVLSAAPWDLTYDEVNDRLFVALTNGTIEVYDNYVDSNFMSNTPRIIIPSDESQTQISVNLHGIAYDQLSDKLVVSDVGLASSPDDGALFVIENAAMASGNTAVARSIAGPSSMLGNPVDIILTDTTLRVAEKSNDAVLIFSNIFAGASGDIAPNLISSTSKPESLVEIMPSTTLSDVSDIDQGNVSFRGIAASSNVASGPTYGSVSTFSPALNTTLSTFSYNIDIESMTFDLLGDQYTTFDDAVTSMGGIAIASRVATERDSGMYNISRDRIIMGVNTGLISPKGIDVSSANGLIFIAENNETSPGIKIFSSCASGDAMPLATLVPANGARPWDVDYDAQTDRAFLALTNGTIAVFDQVAAKLMSGMTTITGEDRNIVPAISGAGVTAPTNLHGIDFDPASGSIIVSDVGSAASPTDGKIYVIPNAERANGLTDITVNIAGPNSLLGNPVDVMYDGNNLFVAEKSNGVIMRFDNVLSSAGGDVVADSSAPLLGAESVAVLPSYINRL